MRDYPSRSDQIDIPFSAFRSIDAADLLKVHNTVCSSRLDDKFKDIWNRIRRQRNSFIHTVEPASEPIAPIELIEHVLFTNSTLHADIPWMKRRVDHSQNDELVAAYMMSPEASYGGVMQEFAIISRHLPSKSLKGYFGFDRRARQYLCPKCWQESDEDIWYDQRHDWRFAQLMSGPSQSATLRCAFCQEVSTVLRKRCKRTEEKCVSNVLSNEIDSRGMCLVCAQKNEIP